MKPPFDIGRELVKYVNRSVYQNRVGSSNENRQDSGQKSAEFGEEGSLGGSLLTALLRLDSVHSDGAK